MSKRLSIDETIARIGAAKLIEYDHGGGRLYFEGPNGERDLIADFYGAGHYRDYIMAVLMAAVSGALSAHMQVVVDAGESAA